MTRKILTAEIARKSSRIWISKTHNVIVVDIPRPRRSDKSYGRINDTHAYQLTPENLKIAERYK